MRLISLDLKNFRQHLDSTVEFHDGVTGIIGSNGAGKSTILEAIAWALYGAPAIRGTNDTVRSTASEGGGKVNVALAFELAGTTYKVSRTLDASGRSGSAVLEVDGRGLRSGMSEVSDAIARLLGMDYRAFFTSFFTGQKQLEFMSQMDGRQRAAAIGRMLGYDRLTKARDQANEDKKGLQREIETLERGLSDPEELKARRKESEEKLAAAREAQEQAEAEQGAARAAVERLGPVKEASDLKAKRHGEITRRLEIDRLDVSRIEARLAQLNSELQDMESKSRDLTALQSDLRRFEEAGKEYRQLADLQKHEAERQRIAGQISALEEDLRRLESRARLLADSGDRQTKAGILLSEAELALAESDRSIQSCREERVAHEHSTQAQAKEHESRRNEIAEKRAKIAEAGAEGACPMCERPLGEELATVLANFDAQISEITSKTASLENTGDFVAAVDARLAALQSDRDKVASQVKQLRDEKASADAQVAERDSVAKDIVARKSQLSEAQASLAQIPSGFDQARFRELQKVGEELRPVRDKAIALRSALERQPGVAQEAQEQAAILEAKRGELMLANAALDEMSFSAEEHERITHDFDAASASLNASLLQLERQKGEVSIATAILTSVKREEEMLQTKIEELKAKRAERLHLQTLAEAFDKLRIELNDRIRPELEGTASELLTVMTDGRYNAVQVEEDYKAVIVDDGEKKPVISGGEEDVLNLSLRLAISQMIADRAGQEFSLLVLDEVFGSLDDSRRDNVVALLQNLKNRFEQIILITHIESIHDAVDNCLWVEFDEKTKTSRLTDRSGSAPELAAGLLS